MHTYSWRFSNSAQAKQQYNCSFLPCTSYEELHKIEYNNGKNVKSHWIRAIDCHYGKFLQIEQCQLNSWSMLKLLKALLGDKLELLELKEALTDGSIRSNQNLHTSHIFFKKSMTSVFLLLNHQLFQKFKPIVKRI